MRIASYNTRDFLDDRGAAARVVRSIDPDVLCLQEVPRRLFSSFRVRRFAGACGMHWSGHHRGSGGTTIFTSHRVEVERSDHHRLPVAMLARRRGFALAHVRVPGGVSIVVASVHLSLSATERAAHAKLILGAIGAGEEVVVAGDLNETEQGTAWGMIAAQLRPVSPRVATFPAAAPRRMIDVIFASAGLEVSRHTDIAIDERDLIAASDHRPVWIDIDTGSYD